MMKENLKKTSMRIYPIVEEGVERFGVICMDKVSYARELAGENIDNIAVRGFNLESHGGRIVEIFIELVDGTPRTITTREE